MYPPNITENGGETEIVDFYSMDDSIDYLAPNPYGCAALSKCVCTCLLVCACAMVWHCVKFVYYFLPICVRVGVCV